MPGMRDGRAKLAAGERSVSAVRQYMRSPGKLGMMTRIAALAVSVLLGLWHGPAAAADIVRVETVSGQVLQGRLVSNTRSPIR